MKIFKYILFISILGSFFIVNYRQSDKKGFSRLRTSLKITTLIAAILLGLIPDSAETIEPSRNNDRQVILGGRDSSGTPSNLPSNIGRPGQSPSNFPIPSTPPARSRPSKGTNTYTYRTPPKVVDQRLGGAQNTAGAGGESENPEFDDNSPVPNKKQSQESKTFDYDYRSNDPKNKKKSKDQEEIKVVVANDGSIINIEIAQVRDKGLHIPDFVDIDVSNSRFNRGKIKKLKKLDYQDRLKYLRNKGNLSDKIVYEARDKILDFMTAPDTMMVPGFLRSSKIEGTVFINMRLGKIGFRDYGTNKFRTALSMDKEQIEDVANEGFHLFLKAGNR
jgi:hypothetical protein